MNKLCLQFKILTALAMGKLGRKIAGVSQPGLVIYLAGELGTGKTTFARGFLRGLGFGGRVRSPTFNLLEIYQVNDQIICHFDLYRLQQPEELAYIGALDYFNEQNICLVEWPERGQGFLPAADLLLSFDFMPHNRGRVAEVTAVSPRGKKILDILRQ